MGRIGEGEESNLRLVSISAVYIPYINERKGYDESYTVLFALDNEGDVWKCIDGEWTCIYQKPI